MSVAALLAEHGPHIGFGVLIVMLVAFTRERIPSSGVAVIGASAFVLLGYVDDAELLDVFSNSAAITIAAMLVLSAALVRTGALEALTQRVLDVAKTRPKLAIALVLGIALLASAFVNSTPVVVILIPLVVSLASAVGLGAKRLLIPLSYAAILGGTCTLIGTSTNLLVDSIAREQGLPGFGIFDISVVGLGAAIAGGAVLALSGRFLLPSRTAAKARPDTRVGILTELRVEEGFVGIGTPWARASFLAPRDVHVLRVQRGGRRLDPRDGASLVAARDRVVLRVSPEELATLARRPGLALGLRVRRPSGAKERTVRITVAFRSPTIGHRVAEAHFLSRFQVALLGVRRERRLAGPDLATVRVRPGDELWVRGPEGALAGIAADPFLILSSMPVAKPFLRERALATVLTLATAIAVAVLGIAPLHVAAVVGIGFLLAIGSLDTTDAWEALNVDVLVLVYAMLVVGTGLQNCGTVEAIVGWSLPLLHALSPFGVIVVIYALTSLLTETITNNAVAVILTPLVISLAAGLDLPPTPLVVAVMFGASASFATPIGYQTNTLVHVAGDYRFAEFLKVGVPMNIVVGLVTCLAILLWFG